MAEDNNQPQPEAEVQEPVKDGDTPQPEQEPEPKQDGAEEKPQEKVEEPLRTYSQEEWSKRESEKDKEISQAQQQMAQITMQAEIAKAQQSEREAVVKDQKEVDDGSIAPEEAARRQAIRTQQRQATEEMTKQSRILRQMDVEMESKGKILAVQDFGKEYELTPEQITELLNDKEIKTPGDMKAKAADLALERERGKSKLVETPKYDQGQSGGGEISSPEKSLKERYPSMYTKK